MNPAGEELVHRPDPASDGAGFSSTCLARSSRHLVGSRVERSAEGIVVPRKPSICESDISYGRNINSNFTFISRENLHFYPSTVSRAVTNRGLFQSP